MEREGTWLWSHAGLWLPELGSVRALLTKSHSSLGPGPAQGPEQTKSEEK